MKRTGNQLNSPKTPMWKRSDHVLEITSQFSKDVEIAVTTKPPGSIMKWMPLLPFFSGENWSTERLKLFLDFIEEKPILK